MQTLPAATIPTVKVTITPTYLSSGLESGQYAVVLDIGSHRYHYQPKGLVSYPRETADVFAADLDRLFDGVNNPYVVLENSAYFVRVA